MMTLLLSILLAQSGGGAAEWRFEVVHDHAFGACRGTLVLSDESIRYETDHAKHSREWSYPEVETLEIVSPDALRIRSYENAGALKLWSDEVFGFRLEDGAIDENLFAFLEDRSPRPVETRVVFDAADARSRVIEAVPARHDHVFGACQGTLEVMDDRIVYRTGNLRDSRVWRFVDIESYGSTGDFDLRISTRNETVHFDLKLPLGSDTYGYIWEQVRARANRTPTENLR